VLGVNVLGSFLACALLQLPDQSLPADARLFLTTGVLGGFTTYSAFNADTVRMAQSGAYAAAALNVLGTVCLCLIAGRLGWAASQSWTGG